MTPKFIYGDSNSGGRVAFVSLSKVSPIPGIGGCGSGWNMVLPTLRAALLVLLFGLTLTTEAVAADTLDLARKLVHYSGGASLLLHGFEPSLAATTKAPDIFRESFDAAIKDNQAAIAAADDAIAEVNAGIYPEQTLAAEVGFYESPEGQSIIAKNRGPFGSVVWPSPDSANLTRAESRALAKFNADVKSTAQIAARNPKAMDRILSAETNVLIVIRRAAFVNYCNVRNCRAEGVTVP
ncbi:MAG: hypothetical protein ACREFW_08345 [Rhizomicrobium sp.]